MIKICMETALGNLILALEDEKAPITTTHFMRYVDEGYFDGSTFFRSTTDHNQPYNDVKIHVLQGGLTTASFEEHLKNHLNPDTHLAEEAVYNGPYGKISVEPTTKTGLKHLAGTISMGRMETVDSVDDGFFICVEDEPELNFGGKRHGDGHGFPAFGQVIEGMEIIKQINQLPTIGQLIKDKVIIHKVYRVK